MTAHVVGLTPRQFRQLADRCRGLSVTLRHLRRRGVAAWPAGGRVLVFTRFVSHRHTDQAKAAWCRVHLIPGGLSAGAVLIARLCKESKRA